MKKYWFRKKTSRYTSNKLAESKEDKYKMDHNMLETLLNQLNQQLINGTKNCKGKV